MSAAKPCPHIVQSPDLDVVFVMDQHLHATDGFARCRACGVCYLFEMADTAGAVSVFRLSAIGEDAMFATVRSLQKGSCDINRARNEVFSLSNGASALPVLLVMREGTFTGTVPLPVDCNLPNRSWRELPCDGSVISSLGLT